MTDAIQKVLSNIAQGIREPVADIVLKPKAVQIKDTTPIKPASPPKSIPVQTKLNMPLKQPSPMNSSVGMPKPTSQYKSNEKSISRGAGAELWHKIKKNPWKAIGVVMLAISWPIGTAVAGSIMAGVMVKSVYDSHVNKKSSKAQLHSPVSSRRPIHHQQRLQISPSRTPNMNRGHNKSKTGGEHTR